jgi:L-threonylcarbamoyladenylate synthase
VRVEFGVSVPVIDGGACQVGIESTVLSLATGAPIILRPGSITREAIETVIGPVELFNGHVATDIAASSPGQQAKHYAPRAPAYRCDGATFSRLADDAASAKLGLLPDPAAAARNFYASLRALDDRAPEFIVIEMPPDEPRWAALRDRITRATTPWPLAARETS